ncbi:type II toxin-antitoxin system RelE/ParE family toxin [Methyloferula stellata]|uniref:type II toxin-antitoxin system RelE/ParE family toxin n=1 Tax=Methyloferula stellata TaxID=876270 RepID=UPI00047BBA85|nr:type II toxin-antitoxin system RelE/ParE family toxin [Methyloferula stellata]
MGCEVRYTPTATAELAELLDYIAQHSPPGARKVQARIKTIITLLSQHPYAGPLTEDPGLRYIVTTPYPYLIFYEVAEDEGEIVIIALRHSARDPSSKPGNK